MTQARAGAALPTPNPLAATVLNVAWMSILLGIAVQGVVIAVQAAWPATVLADLLGKVTWSALVCSALAVASSASKAVRGVVGLTGFLSAPIAVAAARTVQKTIAGGMAGAASAAAVAPGAWELAVLKAVQYALFGWLICAAQQKGNLKSHVAVGVPIGVAFAAYIAARTWATTDPEVLKPLSIVAKGVGDAAATIGCSIVLWAATALATRKSAA